MRQVLSRLSVATAGQGLVDVTTEVCAWVAGTGLGTGLLVVWCSHSSASLLVQADADPEVRADLLAFLARLAPEGPDLYRHEPGEPDNMPAHLRAAVMPVQVCVPVEQGRPVFGPYQALYLVEHRHGAHRRELVLHLSGED